MNIPPQNLNRAIKNDLINLDQLITISKSLGHNFFYDVAAIVDKEIGSGKPTRPVEDSTSSKLVPVSEVESLVEKLLNQKKVTTKPIAKKARRKK